MTILDLSDNFGGGAGEAADGRLGVTVAVNERGVPVTARSVLAMLMAPPGWQGEAAAQAALAIGTDRTVRTMMRRMREAGLVAKDGRGWRASDLGTALMTGRPPPPKPWAGLSARTIELELPYPPSGNTATRHVRGGAHYKTAGTQAYRVAVARALAEVGLGLGTAAEPLKGPLALSWLLLPPDKRGRDVDNARKEMADALTAAGLWKDDSNRVIRRESFEWGPELPGGRVELTVEVLG